MDPPGSKMPKHEKLQAKIVAKKKEKESSDEDLFRDSPREPTKVKNNKQSNKKKADSSDSQSEGNADPHSFKLGTEKKRVSVGTFKNFLLINIRQYYEKNGEWLPTKTGITLNPQQWNQLKSLIPKIDKSISQLSKE